MVKKIKAIDIVTEEGKAEPQELEPTIEPVKVETPKNNEDDPVGSSLDKPGEHPPDKPIEDDVQPSSLSKVGHQCPSLSDKDEQRCSSLSDKPQDNLNKTTCPKCGKTMLTKSYKYRHQAVCGKARLRPEQQEAKYQSKSEPESIHVNVVKTVTQPTYFELKRQYDEQLRERKQQLVKRLISKAF